MSRFQSDDEFRTAIEQVFQLMNDHPDVGPGLNRAQVPHRFVFSDPDFEFDVTYTDPEQAAEGRHLRWSWDGEGVDWEPTVTLKMAGDVANRYFQGKENIAMAVASGRIKLRGSLKKILELAPLTRPVFSLYREWLEDEGHDHLLC